MRISWIACAGILALAAAPAYAGVGKGDFETGVSVSLNSSTTSVDQDFGGGTCTQKTKTESGSIGGNIGYFVLDMLELKAAVTATRSGTELSGSCSTSTTPTTTLGVFSPGADFVFLGKGKVAPFVGAAYGLTFGDTVGVDTDYIDIHAGAKFFLTERAAIELKLTRFEPVDSNADGRTELAVGINVYL